MKRTLLLLLLISTLFFIGCGPKEITSEELKDLVAAEFNAEVLELNIISQTLNEKSIEAEVFINIEKDGIAQEGLTDTKLLYNEESKSWEIYYMDVDSKGWKYSPTVSVLEIIDINNIADEFFGYTGIDMAYGKSIGYNENNFIISDVESVEFNKATGTEQVKFTLEYNDSDFIGSTEVIVEFEFMNKEWRYAGNTQYSPIEIDWINEPNLEANIEDIQIGYSSGIFAKNLKISIGEDYYYLNDEDISEYDFIGDFKIEDTKSMSVPARLKIKTNIATLEVDVTAYYEKENELWEYSSMDVNSDADYSYNLDLIGTWEGYYILSGKRSGKLEVKNYLESANIYEGIFSFGSSDTYTSETGSYHVTIEPQFHNDKIYIRAGEWIEKPSGYYSVSFNINFEDEKLIGKAINMWSSGNIELTRVTE